MSKVLVTEQHLMNIAAAIREKLDTEDTYRPGDMAAAIREIEGGYPEPTGTVSITQNGTANVKDYASAAVNVQPNLQQKTATQNGTVTPDQGYDGLSSVTVNVSQGFYGDGREYLYIWRFQNNSGIIHVSKTGEVRFENGSPEIDGEHVYKAANSDVVTAKNHCFVKTANYSAMSAEAEKNQNDTILSAMALYEGLVIAYDESSQLSDYEIGFSWAIGGSTIRYIIKANGLFVPHSDTVLGDRIKFIPVQGGQAIPVTANQNYTGIVYGWIGIGTDTFGYTLNKRSAVGAAYVTPAAGTSAIYFAAPDDD